MKLILQNPQFRFLVNIDQIDLFEFCFTVENKFFKIVEVEIYIIIESFREIAYFIVDQEYLKLIW